jgi:hypothetical protein
MHVADELASPSDVAPLPPSLSLPSRLGGSGARRRKDQTYADAGYEIGDLRDWPGGGSEFLGGGLFTRG